MPQSSAAPLPAAPSSTALSSTAHASKAICSRDLQDWIAAVFTPLPALGGTMQRWCCADFLGHVQRLALALPEGKFAINLCENRYLFMVAFCAAILRRQTTLLPQNRAPGTRQRLLNDYPGAYILHDGITLESADGLALNVNEHNLLGAPADAVPRVELDFLAALAFTSGSTGQPKPNAKYWRTLVESSHINARHMLPADGSLCYTLATVPAQHMWGLETSVLLPLFAAVCIADIKPFFPQDVFTALEHTPAPRLLISTPVHLRALTQSGIRWPEIQRVLCATAPLPASLAQLVEAQMRGQLIEVFGCSEVGSMACRRTALENEWQLFDCLAFIPDTSAAGAYRVEAAHLPESVVLQDLIEFSAVDRFRLLGRNEDMLEIGGKRGSLQEMNNLLLTAPGVLDGVVFMPDEVQQAGTARPVALAVINSEVSSKAALLARFAEFLDPVFIPRPLYLVDALPREENGKLRRARLLEFWQELKR